jgi:cellulose biosynthesis protein BcsQ
MAKIFAFLGEKGGSGKSSLAHFFAHGLGSLPKSIDAVVVITDPGDDIDQIPRRYYVVDGRDHTQLPVLLKTLDEQSEQLVVVVDGAANRVAVDAAMDKIADLILIPFTSAYQDATRAAKHLGRLPRAVAVPNRWPAHPSVKKEANELLALLPPDRVMGPVQALGKISDILHPLRYSRVATPLSRPAQGFALEVLHRAGIHPFDLHRRG